MPQYTSVATLIASVQSAYALQIPTMAKPTPAFGRADAVFMATGTSFLPAETVERAKAGNPVEKLKLEKDGTSAYTDVYEFAKAIRAGSLTWEEVEKNDMDQRLKWVGLLHRAKRTPGRFMARLRTPNGIVTSEQMRFYADSVEPYGPDLGVVDITTRQNIQLRGVTLEDADKIIDGLHERNQTTFMSALDNVRNLVGSPLAGIDDKELIDTRPFCNAIQDWYTIDPVTGKRGNPKWGNLPRKFNVAISGSRDDYAHTHINDIGLVPAANKAGEMGFNVVLGGYMSIKRVAESVPMDLWIPADTGLVIGLTEAILRIFRDEGARGDRQKARLMWLVEEYGVAEFKAAVLAEMKTNGVDTSKAEAAQAEPKDHFERRELLGVHPQPQAGLSRVGVHVPSGRLSPAECRHIADLADTYSAGEIRLTVEQNIILPNVHNDKVDALLAEPALSGESRLQVAPGNIIGNTVSCTGSQFCGLALVETKANAEEVARKLDALVEVPKPLRIHWTGCPNSCGQVQVADIGIMGAPAKKFDEESGKNKAVPGCNIFVGGKIGEEAHLALEPLKKGIPLDHDDLIPELVDIIVDHFGGKRK